MTFSDFFAAGSYTKCLLCVLSYNSACAKKNRNELIHLPMTVFRTSRTPSSLKTKLSPLTTGELTRYNLTQRVSIIRSNQLLTYRSASDPYWSIISSGSG